MLHTIVGESNACWHCVDQYLCNSSPNIHGTGLNSMVWIYVIFQSCDFTSLMSVS